MEFMMLRFVLAGIFIISAYKWGDWNNWDKYYSTMLFFGMGDIIYFAIFHNIPLWRFETSILFPPMNELFVIFTIFFSTTLLFLSNLPKNLYHQIAYMFFWIIIYITIELFTLSIGMVTHHHGWNMWYSLLFDIILFPLLILHYQKPILAWIVAFIFLVIIMKIFTIPFMISS